MVNVRELKPAVFDFEEPLSKVIAELSRTGTCVIITKNKKYEGVIDDHSITRIPSDPTKTKAGNYAVSAPVLSRGSSLLEIVRLFHGSSFKALPVVEKGKPVAAIARAEVLESLAREKLLPKGLVADFMSAPAILISESDSVLQARAKIREKNVKRLVVVDSEGRFSGVIGNYDLNTFISAPKEKPPLTKKKLGLGEQPVSSIMRESVATILPTASLSDAALAMAGTDVSDIVVVDSGKPVGLISARDIFANLLVSAEATPTQISGLGLEEKEQRASVQSYIDRFLRKQGGHVQSLKLNVKKQSKKGARHLYQISASIETNREKFNAKTEGWDFKLAVHEVLDELDKLAAKSKKNPLHKQGHRR